MYTATLNTYKTLFVTLSFFIYSDEGKYIQNNK